jgi:hypothetical protein
MFKEREGVIKQRKTWIQRSELSTVQREKGKATASEKDWACGAIKGISDPARSWGMFGS